MSGYGTIKEYRDDPDFGTYSDDNINIEEITESIRSNVYKVNNGATAIERAVKGIGTERDSSQLRDKIHETSTQTNKAITQTTKYFRQCSSIRATKAQRLQLDLLKSNFEDALKRFQVVQKKAADKVKSTAKLGSSAKPSQGGPLIDLDNENDRAPLMEQEQARTQMLKEQEIVIEDDLALIREREERIHQLEADILDVNEIFRELGAMVSAQGEVLDTIDSNVERAAGNVESGNEQLVKAAEYQRKSRRKMCCLLVIFMVIAVIVTIIIVVSVKS